MFSGDKRVTFDGGLDTRASIYIVQDKAYPLAILAIIPEVTQYK
jgi:hypothetical protein